MPSFEFDPTRQQTTIKRERVSQSSQGSVIPRADPTGRIAEDFTVRPRVCDLWDNSARSITGSKALLRWGSTRISDSIFTLVGSTVWVTIGKAGRYEISVDVSANITSGTSASNCQFWLNLDTGSGDADVSGATMFTFHLNATNGEATASLRCHLDLNVGDRLSVYAQRIAGTSTIATIAGGSRFTIRELRGAAA